MTYSKAVSRSHLFAALGTGLSPPQLFGWPEAAGHERDCPFSGHRGSNDARLTPVVMAWPLKDFRSGPGPNRSVCLAACRKGHIETTMGEVVIGRRGCCTTIDRGGTAGSDGIMNVPANDVRVVDFRPGVDHRAALVPENLLLRSLFPCERKPPITKCWRGNPDLIGASAIVHGIDLARKV